MIDIIFFGGGIHALLVAWLGQLHFLTSRRRERSMKTEATLLAGQKETTNHKEKERVRERESLNYFARFLL